MMCPPDYGDLRYFWLLLGQDAQPLREMSNLLLEVRRYKLLILGLVTNLSNLSNLFTG